MQSRIYMIRAIVLTKLLLMGVLPAQAQSEDGPSARKAFGLSLLLPGTGHYYAAGGNWDGSATAFVAAETGLWAGLVATLVRRSDVISAYESLASTRAGANVEGKPRTFFLNLANYRSSDDYRDAMLRSRAWDQVDFVADRTNQWAWQSETDFLRYRDLRDDAESLGRRRAMIIALMGANRLVSGISAARTAGKIQRQNGVELSLDAHPSSSLPLIEFTLRW